MDGTLYLTGVSAFIEFEAQLEVDGAQMVGFVAIAGQQLAISSYR